MTDRFFDGDQIAADFDDVRVSRLPRKTNSGICTPPR